MVLLLLEVGKEVVLLRLGVILTVREPVSRVLLCCSSFCAILPFCKSSSCVADGFAGELIRAGATGWFKCGGAARSTAARRLVQTGGQCKSQALAERTQS
jgi:hypothetical protein